MDRLPQASAVPYRERNGAPEYLLVTSQKGNWIFPKGIIDPGESAEQTALKEAREEGGVNGRITGAPLGRYTYEKWDSLCDVVVYLLKVESEDDTWLESGARKRAWFRLEEARRAIQKKKLREILELAHAALTTTPRR